MRRPSQFWPEKRDELHRCMQTIDQSNSAWASYATGPDIDRSGWR